jgi:mRNA deadenylase 3'-5' endonuclease subunit Ccr4
MEFIQSNSGTSPVILTGDFNAEAHEPVYKRITRTLTSAYYASQCDGFFGETLYSNWTRRRDEDETKQTVDYIFYSKQKLRVTSLLDLYCDDLNSPLPNAQYPSDHLSLAARFQLLHQH